MTSKMKNNIMINLTYRNEGALARTIKRARERNVIIPTFKQMRDPALIPAQITEKLGQVGLPLLS